MYVWMAGHFGRGKDGACSVVVLEVDILKFYNSVNYGHENPVWTHCNYWGGGRTGK